MSAADHQAATLLVFSDDWGRHPSSCQHLVKRLLDHHHVIWVNTIGMRPPRLDRQTLQRGLGKLTQWLTPRSAKTLPPAGAAPQVLNPRMWPWMKSPWQRSLNDRLLVNQLRPVLESVPGPIVGVTTVPLAAGLIGRLPVERWIYYCVDDFTQWPGLDGDTIRDQEIQLFRGCDEVVAASAHLYERALAAGCRASLLTHGVDFEHWTTAGESVAECDSSTPKPLVLFFGLIDERLDREWLMKLDESLEAGSIHLLGPCQQSPASPQHRRVTIAPPLSYETLPAFARQADVLIMPYIDADVTRAMQPLKLLEYLATGKPVVVRDLPANRAWADCLDLASTAEEFARLVRLRLETGLPPNQAAARARLVHESWDAKADVFRQTLLGLNSVATSAI
ncbi:MAG TPA: glycosyltransferase [Planctomycetaceae bacterium]|nr:glycosyltransferase [Planctomycetaceae bacterium]